MSHDVLNVPVAAHGLDGDPVEETQEMHERVEEK